MTGARRALRVGHGPRAVEAGLLRDLRPLIEAGVEDPGRLASPVRIVVPSRSLREHLAAVIVAEIGAVAGVSIQTLYSLALEIAERTGEGAPVGSALSAVMVRRLARAEPVLRDGFEPFVDGYGPVEAGVADLLDAGFEPHHAEILDEGIVASGEAGLEAERARALVRVAARVGASLAEHSVRHRSQLFRAARERFESDPAGALPCRALFVHGFADATGVQADWIEALVRYGGARLLLDHPRDPASAEGASETEFTRRFSERLEAAAGGVETVAPHGERPRVAVLRAPGPHAEARGVADRVRALLDAGMRPERIGVVARGVAAYAVPLRLHFGRLGIPFSALGERGPSDEVGGRIAALLELVAQGPRLPAERWLDLCVFPGRSSSEATSVEAADLGLALHARGVARLVDVASLEISEPESEETLALPVRTGLREDDAGTGRLPHRRIRRALLERAIAAARSLGERFGQQPEHDRLNAHREWLRRLIDDDLHWRSDSRERSALEAAIFAPRAELPSDFELGRDDFVLLLGRVLEGAGSTPLGGEGAGVAVLNVMEARARTFDHLFVMGLGRGLFPRPVVEDPLLSDGLRRRLRAVLPDLPVKSEGHDEDRYLFAQLLSASPEVTLSCSVTDDDGKPHPVSPLVERLQSDGTVPEPVAIPSLYGVCAPAGADASRTPRPAHEHAILTGLYGSRKRFERVLRIALDEGAAKGPGTGRAEPLVLARSRCAVLAELDPPSSQPRDPGPYFGYTGGPPGATDTAAAETPYVTVLEGLAGCPWRTFLSRVLRLELPPDSLGELPGVEPVTLGSVVHHALERIALQALGEVPVDLDAAWRRDPVPVRWPDGETLEALVRSCAESVAREEGIALRGFERILAKRALARLEIARERDWSEPDAPVPVLGAELTASVALPDAHGQERTVRFRADRVDRSEDGLRLTDYKTGKPPDTLKTLSKREEHHHQRVARGEMLQATAYALAGGRYAPAQGRYLFLDPNTPEYACSLEVRSDDEAFAAAFESAVRTVLEVWDRGAFFPRLADAKGREPDRCGWCEMRVACLRGDSGARRRLEGWAGAAGADAAERDRSPAEQALLGGWKLGEGA
jgi:hypothetical protein